MAHFKLAATRAAILPLVLLLASCGGGGGSDSGKFTVAGTLSGLKGVSVILRLNDGLDLVLVANGAFHFSTKVAEGGAYAVTVNSQPLSPSQTCTVADGTGTATADVSNVTVTCTTTFFKVKGTLTGLAGGTVVLQNNGGDDITLTADGAYEFATPIESGTAVKVTVLTQPSPPPQSCVVTGGTGTMGNADTNIPVTCKRTYSVGGTVTGLAGSGLVLRNNAGDDLPVSADGAFTFSTRVATGAAYAVTVKTQPTSPTQQCTVTSGSGTIASVDITNVAVNCVTASGVAGKVQGLDVPGLVLRISGGEELTVNSNGTFKFSTALPQGTAYKVTAVAGTPASPRHVCNVLNGSGTIGVNADITNIDVTCEADRFAYVLHPTQVTALVANHETGALSPIEGTASIATASGAVDIAADPRGRFVYVASYSAETAQSFISGYRVDSSTGALAPLPGSPLAAEIATRRLSIDSAGRFLYAANATSSQVSGWAIHANGTLTPVQASPQSFGDAPCAIRQAPLSNSQLVISSSSSQLMLFRKEANSSPPERLAVEALVSGNYCGAATDPYGHFVYVPRLDYPSNYLYGFSVAEDGATLEPLTLNPVAPTNTYTLSAQQPRAMVLRYSQRDREMLQIR